MPEPMSETRMSAILGFLKSQVQSAHHTYGISPKEAEDAVEYAEELIAEIKRGREEAARLRNVIHDIAWERGQIRHLERMEEMVQGIYPELRGRKET